MSTPQFPRRSRPKNRFGAVLLTGLVWFLPGFSTAAVMGGEVANPIRLDTVGYLPNQLKVATLAGPTERFVVRRFSDGPVVFADLTDGPHTNPDTEEQLRLADFTPLAEPGRYVLEAEGLGRSAPFTIGPDVYREPFRLAVQGFYLWRCGQAVRAEHQGHRFLHGPCHTNDALLDFVGQPGGRVDLTGGWHDAGDYGKYVVNGAFSVGLLLRAWEDFGPAIVEVSLGYPSQADGLPGFLAEVRWELDWQLKRQAPDGRVWHKVSRREFAPMIRPDQDHAPRYAAPASTAATADVAAACAQAARVFRPYDPAYADRLLAAARKSHAVLQETPQNVPAPLSGFRTGAYQTQDEDDRLWAAAELWATTGEPLFREEVQRRLQQRDCRVDVEFDWSSVGNLAVFTCLGSRAAELEPNLLKELERNLLRTADRIVETASRHGYGRPLDRYYWGCNGTVARQSLTLHAAWRLSARAAYRQTAAEAIHYLLGRNFHGRSYVTGLGDQPPRHPHDRRSASDTVEPPWPGYLVGGPHPRPTDWRDEQATYRLNEIAINWNAALVYALAAFLDGAENALEAAVRPPRLPDVVFVPTPQKVVDRMLELAELKPDDLLYDLGCGDGRIVVTAAKRYGVRAVGVDIDPRRVAEARANVRTNHLEHLVTIMQADIFELDFKDATVVTLYLLPELNVRLMPQLARLKPGTRILSHDFDMRGAKPVHVEDLVVHDPELADFGYEITEHRIYKWVVPWEPEPAAESP